VNDAFSVSHRLHASVVGISKYLPSYAGFLLETEVIKIEKAINQKTKAMVIIDIFGHSVDWDPIIKIAKKYKLKIIEDSCEAIGAEYKGKEMRKLRRNIYFCFFIPINK